MEKPYALIVEDDRDIAALFRHVLDIAGYRTEVGGRDCARRRQTHAIARSCPPGRSG